MNAEGLLRQPFRRIRSIFPVANRPAGRGAGEPSGIAHVFIDYWNIVLSVRGAARKGRHRADLDWTRFPTKLVRQAAAELHIESLRHARTHIFTSYNPDRESGLRGRDWVDNVLRRKPRTTVHQFQRVREQEAPRCPHCGAQVAVCPNCNKDFRGYQEKGVDVALAIAMAEGAWDRQFDVAVLVCSDRDLIPAIQSAKRHGSQVVYAAVPPGSDAVREVCDAAIEIDASDPAILY